MWKQFVLNFKHVTSFNDTNYSMGDREMVMTVYFLLLFFLNKWDWLMLKKKHSIKSRNHGLCVSENKSTIIYLGRKLQWWLDAIEVFYTIRISYSGVWECKQFERGEQDKKYWCGFIQVSTSDLVEA